MAGRTAQVVDVRDVQRRRSASVLTTSRGVKAGGGLPTSVVAFVEEAERMLARSRAALRTDDAVVFAYRAALRTAGAAIENTMLSRKRRPRGSAWDRLDTVLPELAEWAELFRVHGRFANRVGMGLDSNVSQEHVDRIYADAERFLDEVRGQLGYVVGLGGDNSVTA